MRNFKHLNFTANLKSSNVRPYVTISLKDQSVRTTTAEGTNPCWNEQLRLPLK
jgi:coiled-coil and C2 domain-containing protein 2A